MTYVEDDSALSSFQEVGQQVTCVIQHRDRRVECMRIDVTWAKFLQHEILKRPLRAEIAEIDHHGDICNSACFHPTFYGCPVRAAVMCHFDSDNRVPICYGQIRSRF